jgi:hypothetical protein
LIKVQAHGGNYYNDLVDSLAKQAANTSTEPLLPIQYFYKIPIFHQNILYPPVKALMNYILIISFKNNFHKTSFQKQMTQF